MERIETMNARLWLRGILCVAVAGAPLGIAVAEEDDDVPAADGASTPVQQGKRVFRSCAGCHCATDSGIPEDDDWLRMNRTTACFKAEDATPETRQALETYLKSDKVIRPVLVTEALAPKPGLPYGAVGLPEVAGSAYLKAGGDAVAKGAPAKIRLYWKAGQKGRTLPLPAGEYRVISYALYGRGGKESVERWMMTATNVNGCVELTVEEGKTTVLELKPVFVGDAYAESKEDKVKILYSQTDPNGNVATLSVNGDVRRPECRVLDAGGREVHRALLDNT